MEKPWLEEGNAVVNLHDGRMFPMPQAKLGLRVFLGVAMVLFSLMVAAGIRCTTVTPHSVW